MESRVADGSARPVRDYGNAMTAHAAMHPDQRVSRGEVHATRLVAGHLHRHGLDDARAGEIRAGRARKIMRTPPGPAARPTGRQPPLAKRQNRLTAAPAED